MKAAKGNCKAPDLSPQEVGVSPAAYRDWTQIWFRVAPGRSDKGGARRIYITCMHSFYYMVGYMIWHDLIEYDMLQSMVYDM